MCVSWSFGTTFASGLESSPDAPEAVEANACDDDEDDNNDYNRPKEGRKEGR